MSSSEVATKDLDPPILSQKIRINPQTFVGDNIAMRLELSGCSQDEQKYCKYMAPVSFLQVSRYQSVHEARGGGERGGRG